MKQLRIRKYNAFILLAALALGSCAEDELPAPMKKAKTVVKLTADWSKCSSDVLPENYVVRIGNDMQPVKGNVNTFTLYADDDYSMLTYNEPQGITISGNTATLNTVTTRAGGVPESVVSGNPGNLFSASNELLKDELLKLADDTLRLGIQMQQHTRRVNLNMNVNETGIRAATGVLDNVASSIDLTTGELIGVASASVSFTPSQSAGSNQQLAATLCLLGVAKEEGKKQTMKVELTMQDATTKTVETDLTSVLSKLDESNEPLEITGSMTQSGVGGTVINWTVVEGGDLSIK